VTVVPKEGEHCFVPEQKYVRLPGIVHGAPAILVLERDAPGRGQSA
jgi:hypothetical protein